MGKTYAGDVSSESVTPKHIYVGNTSNLSEECKVVYMGNSSNKSVEVWRNNTLPSEYQKVEYIFNTGGTQYIDTGVKPNSDTTIIVDFTPTSFPTSGNIYSAVFGLYMSFQVRFSLDVGQSPNKFIAYFGTASSNTIASGLSANTRYLVEFNQPGGKFYVNGTLGYTSTYTFSTLNHNMLLFGQWVFDHDNTPAQAYIRMHHFQVKQGGTMIRDMWPCYEKADTQNVGMYDLIGGQFYGNDGTGIFYKGPDIN